eukprot:scaffold9.g3242.t1
MRARRLSVKAAAGNGAQPAGLAIDLRGKKAFIAGVADDQASSLGRACTAPAPSVAALPRRRPRFSTAPEPGGAGAPRQPRRVAGAAPPAIWRRGFAWAIAKRLAEAGAEISLGVWVPALNIFESSYRRGKFDESRKLSNGGLLEFSHIYPMDAVFDTPEDVPEDRSKLRWERSAQIASNKRYAGNKEWTVSEVAAQRFGPLMNPGGAAIALTYVAADRVIPGYGGGMSSAKAALESDTKVLAYEAGRKFGVRVNSISAGPLGSRAAKAIGFIDDMIKYSYENAPVQKELNALEVGSAAAFLLSPLASAITGGVIYVDNGLNIMGLATDSKALDREFAHSA